MTTLRVFLSSTSVDLEAYRTRVASLVQRLGLFAATMDQFPLQPQEDATSVSLKELRESDVYILLLGWRYGHVPHGQPLSVTHQEYQEARRLGLPCFVFLADDATDEDKTLFPDSVRDHRDQVLAFRAEVRQQQLVATFRSVEDLVDRVAAALYQFLLDRGLPGRIPHDLPPRVPGFVGRGKELAQLMTTLRQGQSVGLSALVAGLGGVGKSALASEVLHRLAGDPAFPGGIAWVRCDGRTGLDGLAWVYDQVLSAWGLRIPPDALHGASTPEAEVEVREGFLRDRLRLPGPGLLLLDNVEVDLPLVRALEHLTPQGLTLLVTARHRPSLPGLRLVPLDVLDTDAAVQLFQERYTDRGGSWDPDRDTSPARIVVERLGWLALAVELAAARAAVTGVGVQGLAMEMQRPEVLARLRDPLKEEAGVRYSLERSLTVLSRAQRIRFAALGLPDGPDWPRPVIEVLLGLVSLAEVRMEASAAQALAEADLDRLAALSLVLLVPPSTTDGVVRVRVHPLLREIAADEWSRQPTAVLLAGLVGLVMGAQAWAGTHQTRDAETYAVLEADEALMVGALRHAMDAKVALEQVLDTAFSLGYYLVDGGHWRVGVAVWTLAFEATRLVGDRENEGACLSNLGVLYRHLGGPDQARRSHEQSLAILRESGNQHGESVNLLNLGILAMDRGDLDEARRLYDQALAIKRQQGDREGEANALLNLGIVAYLQDNYALSHRALEHALTITREVGDNAQEALTLSNLGELALAEGDLALAKRWLDQALPLARAAGKCEVECFLLSGLAAVARREGQWSVAQRLLDEALILSRTLGSREREAQVLAETARLQRDQGETDVARQTFIEALTIYEIVGQGQGTPARKVREDLAALDATPPSGHKDPKPKRR